MIFLKGAWRLAVAASIAFCVTTGAAVAQTEAFPNSSVGVIDVQRILAEAEAAKAAREQRETYAAKYSADARKEEQAIHEAQASLARETDQQSDSFRKKRQEFDQQVATYQKKIASLRQSLDRAMAQALSEVQDAMIEKADAVAGERGINLVFYRNQLLLFDPRMNITDEVLKRVNESLPSVTFPDPESLSKAAKE